MARVAELNEIKRDLFLGTRACRIGSGEHMGRVTTPVGGAVAHGVATSRARPVAERMPPMGTSRLADIALAGICTVPPTAGCAVGRKNRLHISTGQKTRRPSATHTATSAPRPGVRLGGRPRRPHGVEVSRVAEATRLARRYSVSPACLSATSQRTKSGCNANACAAITYPIAIREASRTRCKTAYFDAGWLARILFAGRGYLERGR